VAGRCCTRFTIIDSLRAGDVRVRKIVADALHKTLRGTPPSKQRNVSTELLEIAASALGPLSMRSSSPAARASICGLAISRAEHLKQQIDRHDHRRRPALGNASPRQHDFGVSELEVEDVVRVVTRAAV
jgi:hypothetical protein